MPALAPNEKRIALAYARPGAGDVSVKLTDGDGKTVQSGTKVHRDSSAYGREVLDPEDVLYLTLGGRLPGLRRAITPPAENAQDNADDAERGVPGFAVIEDVAYLPDRWIGYEAADFVVLATGSETFVRQLLQDGETPRRDALFDWVRRGGRLVVSVGRNHQLAGELLEKMKLIDCSVGGSAKRATLAGVTLWSGREAQQQKALRQVEIAILKPGTGTDVLVREEPDGDDLEERDVVVQGPCGLGRVILVAFDLDTPPFSTWEGQSAFWKKVQAEAAPRLGDRNRPELVGELQRAVETFGEVSVIPFGWVALFLLFYIALVGPIDYFILKKVFKRLEWTWLTFPIVVIVVSIAAYFTARWAKGDQLWVNKVDLVDIDLHSRQAYGSTWWALFNPQSQAFTVGLEPAAPGWFVPPQSEMPAAVVAPLEVQQRSGAPSGLFRNAYELADEATGVRGMPVPVWATRAFSAAWRVPLTGPVQPIEAELRPSRDGDALAGTLVNNLPVELQGAALFYRGQWCPVGTLLPGQRLEVQSLFERNVFRRPMEEWFTDGSLAPQAPVAVPEHARRPRVEAALLSYAALKPALFHDLGNSKDGNSGLRQLDQGWRLAPLSAVPTTPQRRYRAEAILVARAPSAADRAEDVTAGGPSPSRLWLGALPGSGVARPKLDGYLSQETYLRVFIPVTRPR